MTSKRAIRWGWLVPARKIWEVSASEMLVISADCEEFKTSAVWSEKLVLNLKIPHQSSTLVLTSFGGVYVAAAQLLARRFPRRLTLGESAVAALDRDDVTVEDLQWAWDRLDSVVHPSDLHRRSENSKTTELCECGRHWFRKNVEEDWRFLKMVLFSCFVARTTQLCLPACWAFSYWSRYCWQPCRWPAVHLEPKSTWMKVLSFPQPTWPFTSLPLSGPIFWTKRSTPNERTIGSGYRPKKWSKENEQQGLEQPISDFWRSWCRLMVPFMAKFEFNSK